ncbi:DNA/RNA non-specific endonuclease [Mucilaginibacter sp. BT774]|uniref:DNA/RNA non-specific endonuclease n=1 Tax=Mucilaginibacter sp. BT774 TaxID=3062276 RepID=UPI0026744119|nr:DNA/RNA non-specific endonuclease [Mucilaginibacter sp. BT774]MDO3627739.1 DNA/RNA non-specific endonuclease [Mucilaginibacter sp. BT774]
MKIKSRLLVLILTILVFTSGCNSNKNQLTSGESPKEDFEQTDKPASKSYTTGSFKFKSGAWLLKDALVGTSDRDSKTGIHAIRIRNNGKLSMQFDMQNVGKVTIHYATYGNDKSSELQLWVSYNNGGSYQQIGQTMTASSHELAYFIASINQTGPVRIEIRKVSGGKNRINIDDIVFTGIERKSAQNNTNTTAASTDNPVPGDDWNLLLGNPSNATDNTSISADNYLIDHHYYIESYSKTKAEPNWVSWHIGAGDITGKRGPDDFRADTTLPPKWFKVDNTYYRGSGFDKGHNCPSGDRSSSSDANSATFLMDNIIPQAPNNNQHTWEHLESFCRDRVKDGNEVYVIMGSYGTGGTGRNGYATSIYKGRINVPAHIWKIAVIIPNGNNDLHRITSQTQVIAIDTPNDDSIDPNWMKYICTVRDIEKVTGYNLLSALPQNVQDAVETKPFRGF